MDRYSILDQDSSAGGPKTTLPKDNQSQPSPPETSPDPLHFPGDDGGRSLTEMAQRDLGAALQLLAERAQYITGASGAAIALRQGEHMVCRASAGTAAPELGAHLQVNSGLSGESVRLRRILRCDDAETDPRVNRESCRALGIASVVVMPLVREDEVNGVFELLSDRTSAFEERDLTALERLGEMIQTAVEHAQAAERAPKEIAGKENKPSVPPVAAELAAQLAAQTKIEPAAAKVSPAPATTTEVPPAAVAAGERPVTKESEPKVLLGEPGNIGKCASCGFPVSAGRAFCLDCEKARASDEAAPRPVPAFLSQLAAGEARKGWLSRHSYFIATLLVAAITVLALLWRRW
jgi:putative methionine-R-sulfoxide reductase with GAF domain